MPIEDASVLWSEEQSAQQTIGRISIPAQDAYSPEKRVYGDDALSFSPWRALAAHQPLGSIMRVRRPNYEKSSQFRHTMNAQPRVEPKSLNDIPN